MLYSTALVWATSNLSLFEEKPEDTTVEFLECALEAISSVVSEEDSQVPESADAAAAAQSAQSTPAPGTSAAGWAAPILAPPAATQVCRDDTTANSLSGLVWRPRRPQTPHRSPRWKSRLTSWTQHGAGVLGRLGPKPNGAAT